MMTTTISPRTASRECMSTSSGSPAFLEAGSSEPRESPGVRMLTWCRFLRRGLRGHPVSITRRRLHLPQVVGPGPIPRVHFEANVPSSKDQQQRSASELMPMKRVAPARSQDRDNGSPGNVSLHRLSQCSAQVASTEIAKKATEERQSGRDATHGSRGGRGAVRGAQELHAAPRAAAFVPASASERGWVGDGDQTPRLGPPRPAPRRMREAETKE